MADYQPVEDASTDQSAAQHNQMTCDVAMMTRMGPRASVTFTGATYTSGTQVLAVTAHRAQWGNAAPVAPTVSQTATGVFIATWPATVTDELGATVSVSFTEIESIAVGGSTVPLLWTFGTVTANTAVFYLWTDAGAASPANAKSIILRMF